MKRNLLTFFYVWFFLIIPVLRTVDNSLIFFAQNISVLFYVLLIIWSVQFLIFTKPPRTLSVGRKLSKNLLIYTFLYVFYSVMVALFYLDSLDIEEFRRNYAPVIPGVTLSILLPIEISRRNEELDNVLRRLYWILVLIVLFSFLLNDGTSARDGGIYGQANDYGFIASLGLILSAVNLRGQVILVKNRVLLAFLFFVFLVAIFRSGSFAGILLGIFLSIWYFYRTQEGLRGIKNSIFLIVTLLFGVIFVLNNVDNHRVKAISGFLEERDRDQINEASTFDLRYELVLLGFDQISKNWLIGSGFEAREVKSLLRGRNYAVHNAFLVEILRGGVFLGIIVVMFYLNLYRIAQKIRNTKLRKVALVMLLFLFLSDNTSTYFSFFSFKHGLFAITVLLTIQLKDELNEFSKI